MLAAGLMAISPVMARADDDDAAAPANTPKTAKHASGSDAAPLVAVHAAGATTVTLGSHDQTATCRASFEDGAAPLTLEKIGTGKITLIGPSTYSGGLSVKGGTLALGNDGDASEDADALGTGLVTVTGNSVLRFGGNPVAKEIEPVPNNIQIDRGTLFCYAGNHHFTGRITVAAGGAAIVTHADGTDVSFDSDITGAGPLTIDGESGGTVHLTNDLSLMGTVTVKGPSPGFSGGRISLEDPDALNQATLITTAGMRGVVFAQKKRPFTVGAITGPGSIDLNGNTVWAGVLGTDFLYTGTLRDSAGGAGFAKIGKGTMTLAGAQNFTGRMSVYSGVLLVTSAIPCEIKVGDPKIPLTGATLMGSGPMGNVLLQTPGAVVQPGNSPGQPGMLYAKNFSMTPGSTLNVRLKNAAVTDVKEGGYDQVCATGQFSLSGNLQVSLLSGFQAKPGDAFYILITTGTAPVLGHFSNVISEEITVDGHRFALSYTADHNANDPLSKTGHDVALIVKADGP